MNQSTFGNALVLPPSLVPCVSASAQDPRDTRADAWPATDALGRTLPLHQEAGGAPDRFVGIFYFNWQASFTGPPFNHTRVFDNTKLIAANPNKPAWGPPGIPHYWGEPRFGYYRPDDPWVIRKHVQMLTDAAWTCSFSTPRTASLMTRTRGVVRGAGADARGGAARAANRDARERAAQRGGAASVGDVLQAGQASRNMVPVERQTAAAHAAGRTQR